MAGRRWQEFPGRPDRAATRARSTGGEFVRPFDVQWRLDDGPPPLAATVDAGAHTITITGGVPRYRVFGSLQSVTMEGQPGVAYPVTMGQTITVRDLAGQELVLEIGSGIMPPVITSPATGTGVWGEPFTYQATADVPASFGATGLPAGLAIDAATGAVSGTLVGAGAGPVVFTVSATNAGGTGTRDIIVSMSDPVPPTCVNGDVAYAGMSLTYHRRSLCSASLGTAIDGVLAHVGGSTFTGMATFRDLQPNGDPWGDPYVAELTVILLCSMEDGIPCYDIVEAGNNWTAVIRHNLAHPTGNWANEPDVCTVEWSGLEEHHSGSYSGGSHAVEATFNAHSWTCSNWVSAPYIEWTNTWSATIA